MSLGQCQWIVPLHTGAPPWITGEWLRRTWFCREWRDQVACPRLHSWTMTEFLKESRSSYFIQFRWFDIDQCPVIYITFGRLGVVGASGDVRIIIDAKQVGPQAGQVSDQVGLWQMLWFYFSGIDKALILVLKISSFISYSIRQNKDLDDVN